MNDIINNDSLNKDNGSTTPDSGQSQESATQTTGQDKSAATQTTDAGQAAGGNDNAGGSLQTGAGQQTNGDSSLQQEQPDTGQQQEQAGTDGNQQTGDGGTIETPEDTPTYLADWGNTTFMDAVKGGDKTIAEYMGDYNKWANANGQDPLDVFTMMNAIQGNDVTQSYAENEKAQRKLRRQQRWEQIGNLIAHLGNFVGTITGAPSANYESGTDLTKRQQAVRDAVLKRQGDPKDLLAMIWKDRADRRAAELNAANVALQGARKANVEGQTANQKAVADANVALKGAQQYQAETGAAENEAQTTLTQERTQTEKEMRPLKKENVRSSTRANNARATASTASANASNQRAYGTRYTRDRWKIWARNRRLHPNEFKEFMKNNNIHQDQQTLYGNSRKNWTTSLCDQFNAYIADRQETKGGGGNVSDLLD